MEPFSFTLAQPTPYYGEWHRRMRGEERRGEERGGMNITQSGFFAEGGNANPPSSDNYGCHHRRLSIHPQRFCISITEGRLKAPKPMKRVSFLVTHVLRLGDYTLGSCKTSVSQILRAWVVPHRNASGRSQRRGLWKF